MSRFTFDELLGLLAVGSLALTIATLTARGPLARRTPAHADRSDALDPFEAAHLAGGAQLAVAAAVQALVARGALELVPGEGRVRALGKRPRHLPPLEAAVLLAAERGQDSPGALEARVAADLRGLEAGLAGRGLRPTVARRRLYRLAPVGALLVLWAGLAWVLAEAGPGPDRVAAAIVAIVFSVVLAACTLMEPPRRTARAAALLRGLRNEHREAAKRGERPDAYDAALLTALFGAGAVIGPLVAVGDRPWRARTDIDVELGEALDDNGDGGGDAGDGGGGDGGCGGGGCGGGGD